ncbi:hypothetical protein EG68_09147 [Paragonimus skrjabini miyazakii]|uniref:Coatomer subunit beta n=1 Tax=Paragonimus skrjabini miyazakii TaxID=59628 RepID=A0A8S9YGV9_9TREM|nr:hypothetical protein EG68_09147 [Paragonimus skrjabini miyazakii]
MAGEQICYTLIGLSPEAKSYSEQQLKDDLQHSSVDVKREALKEVIRLIINGEKLPNLLMTVIRFVMPSQDHIIKKLLLLFWEVVPKYGPDGKLLHEMILVCDAYRKDLQHPNEFIRGSTLRFLCKLKEPELLEPLMPAIQQCLEHRHAYVRRNAVLAIFTIYKNFEHLIPDAPEKILQFLEQEQDASCKRNAFMMLVHVSQSSALEYLVDRLDQVQNFGDILQLIIVELIYKVCHQKPSERLRFIRCVYSLLQSSSPAVRYEAAGTLITLSSAPSALKAAASCYVNLILKESDNNVKLIVLSRLTDLRQYHERILQDLVMDIVQILAASDMEIRQKTLDLTMDLVTSRSADELIKLYRKELLKACNGNGAGSGSRVASAIASSTTGSASGSKTTVGSVTNSDEANYRYALVHTIYDIAIRFPETLSTIVPTVCDILTYEEMGDSRAATEACRFLREVCQRYGQKKSEVLEKLVQIFPNVSGQETLRHIIWIFGEFCTTSEEINACITLFRQVIGELPLVDEEMRRQAQDGVGTGTEAPARSVAKAIKRPVLQAALFESAYMPAVVLSACLVKLYYRFKLAISEQVKQDLPIDEESKHRSVEARENAFCAECMLIIASMLHLANSGLLPHQINPDHLDRMWICLKVLSDGRLEVLKAFAETSHVCLGEMLTYQESERKAAAKSRNRTLEQRQQQEAELNRADAPVKFSLLSGQSDLGDMVDRFDLTLSQALGATVKGSGDDAYATSKLSKVRQLTGFSDPIYAEAYVHVNQFDIVLDVLIVNQTRDTLQNLTLELSTQGDLRLVEKPSPLTVAPQDFANMKANIKVSSTENGIIFGNISYDMRGSAGETTCIVLNDIHIDIMEYILPATCSPTEFRQMWSEFEWENKVTVNTQITDLFGYLSHISAQTNLRCLTPMEALLGECDYLCVTMYARTIFGEHVLANLCLEKTGSDQPVSGHVRIRAKTQGMAVTMGEKVSTCQKNWQRPGGLHANVVPNCNTDAEDPDHKLRSDDDGETGVGVMRSHSPARPTLSNN